MFQYFPGNYMWSLAVWRCLTSGGLFGEISWIGQNLVEAAKVPPQGDLEAWYREWIRLSRQLQDLADERVSSGHRVTAADTYLRATHYYQWAEAFLEPDDPRAADAYARHLACFAGYAENAAHKVELLDVPFEGKHLPAYFIPAFGVSGRAPAVILSDGLDGSKEEMFPTALHLARRGVSCLAVDNPGQGAALRLEGLTARHDSEVPAGAAYDFLASRGDVDPKRIGIMAASMGGYYAPRAVAFDKRFKACVAWAAVYDYHAIWVRRFARMGGALSFDTKAALGTTGSHLLHIMGASDFEDALRKLEPFHLRDVAQDIECDILVVQGEDDRQTPYAEARQLFDRIGSKNKEFRLYTKADGGAGHVQIDRSEPANSLIADWLVDHL